MSQTLEKPEAIPGLRQALADEKQQQSVVTTVTRRLQVAKAALAEAETDRESAIAKAALGQEINLSAIDRRISEATSKVTGYEEALDSVTKAAEGAEKAVNILLRRELRKRELACQTAYDMAVENVRRAAAEQREAGEALAVATQTAMHFPSDSIRILFVEQIAEANEAP